MHKKIDNKILVAVLIFSIILMLMFSAVNENKYSKNIKADNGRTEIFIDYNSITGPVPLNWRALSQGGEEKGVRMLENVTSKISVLTPRYIRIDHIYDYYDVATVNPQGGYDLSWDKLDSTVCDIYRAGAKPFFVLGYMPEGLSGKTDLISAPKTWDMWSYIVQKTIERYSGKDTRLCGQVTGDFMKNIYYEVWNEPDLESFGKWSIYGGSKSYLDLYFYSSQGANRAQNVNNFFMGGPVTTALYRNWITNFLDFVDNNNLRLDFISWHHYSKNPNDYTQDMININSWLTGSYVKYANLPKIISEWGYDSDPNPVAESALGAAHTFVSIRNLIEQKLEMAFAFEIKDGPSPRWGLLSYTGEEKPRYKILKLLNMIEGHLLNIYGENDSIKVLASRKNNNISLVIGNYDATNQNTCLTPINIGNIPNGQYSVQTFNLDRQISTQEAIISNGQYSTEIVLQPNEIVGIKMEKN
jgi:hypothetical protein